jgi:hypothetical protein
MEVEAAINVLKDFTVEALSNTVSLWKMTGFIKTL